MKKLLVLCLLLLCVPYLYAQVTPPLLINEQNTKHSKCCCCDCGCDTTRVQYKPINHWADVRHIVYVGVNPVNTFNLNLVASDIEQGRTLMNLMSNTPSLYFGHEHIVGNFSMGGEIGGMFGNTYQQVAPNLNMRMTSAVDIALNLGYHLLTTENLRLYAMGKLQFNYVGLRLQRDLADIPQKSWNRFISSQNELLPYDRLVEGFLTTDRWGNDMNLYSSFFATQLRIGADYRVGKVKIGFHTGYAFQLSSQVRDWRYTYEFEEGDERKHFKVTNTPLNLSLNGLNFGFSVGYLFSDIVK